MAPSTAQRKTLLGCDTAVVLAPHTRSGATMLAKNSDRPPLECQPLFHAPRRRHRNGSMVHCQYIEIPEAAETAMLERASELAERVRNLKGEQRSAMLARFMAQNLVRVMREVARVEAVLADGA